MSELPNEPNLSARQLEMIRNERFIQEILEIRGLSIEKKPEEKASGWLAFLQSGTGAALTTVLLGTIVGGLLTNFVQNRTQEREASNSAFNEFLKSQRTALTDAFSLIGEAIACSRDLAVISTQPFYTGEDDGRTPEARKVLEGQKKKVRESFNALDDRWRRQRITFGLVLRPYQGGSDEVAKSWNNLADAVSRYMQCESSFSNAQSKLAKNDRAQDATKACLGERKAIDDSQDPLFASLASAEQQGVDRGSNSRTFWQTLKQVF